MYNASVQRVNSISLRKHKDDLVQQLENEAKAYRSLLALYAEHLNTFIKVNKDCLADIDYHPRQKINRDEQLALEENIDKIQHKNYERLSKESINRNTITRKNYQEFMRKYSEAFSDDIFEIKQYSKIIDQDKKNLKNTLSNKKISPASAHTRPLTSKAYPKNHPSACSTQTGTFSMSCKMKPVSTYMFSNPEAKAQGQFIPVINGIWPRQCVKNSKRFFLQASRRGEEVTERKQADITDEQFVFNGSEILISQHKRYPSTIFKEKKNVAVPQKLGMKKMLTMKFAQRKSIDEIEKMQIQNRITMVSSVLAVNLPNSQGYRPKSRCWQNYFN